MKYSTDKQINKSAIRSGNEEVTSMHGKRHSADRPEEVAKVQMRMDRTTRLAENFIGHRDIRGSLVVVGVDRWLAYVFVNNEKLPGLAG